MKKFLQAKTIVPCLLGADICAVLFILGEAEDAPGLCFIGLIAAFLLILRGIYHAGVMRKGVHIPIVLLVFGAIGIVFPYVLLLDGEITGAAPVAIGNIIGIALTAAALIRIVKVRKKS